MRRHTAGSTRTIVLGAIALAGECTISNGAPAYNGGTITGTPLPVNARLDIDHAAGPGLRGRHGAHSPTACGPRSAADSVERTG